MGKRLPCAAALLAALAGTPVAARAAAPITIVLLTNRTGPYSVVGTRVANGMRDYFALMNQRDGGVGRSPLDVVECEVGSDVARGLSCYAAAREAGAVLVSPPDRPTTRALLESSAADRIPILSVADGFPVGTRGDVLPWVFNPSAMALGGMTIAIRYLADKAGGLSELQGLSIGLVYSGSGADPSALEILRELAARHGFKAPLFPLDDAQGGTVEIWNAVAARPPDYLILLGQGAQTGVAVERAMRVGYPPERLIALRWPDEETIRAAGSAGRGFKEVSRHAFGDGFPAFDAIDQYVVDRGLSPTPKAGSGETHYNRGVYNAVIVVEAIRAAQKRRGDAPVRGEDLRRALEVVTIDQARWKELGLAGFAPAVALTCRDHGGQPAGFVQVWDGAKWLRGSGPIHPMMDLVGARLDAAVAEFRAANPGWPARTEPCEQAAGAPIPQETGPRIER